MSQVHLDQAPKLVGEPLQFVGQQVETEQLDGNQAVAIGLIRAVDRSQNPGPDLMQDAIRSEDVGRRSTRSVGVQAGYSSRKATRS